MKRLVIQAVIKMGAESLLISIVIAVGIGIVGYIQKWSSLVEYSNAFFLSGCLVIVAGGLARLGAGQEWSIFQLLDAQAFREMGSSEKASFIVDASSSLHLVILGALSGLWLLLVSAAAAFIP